MGFLFLILSLISILTEVAHSQEACKINEWPCANGTCIDTTKKCNGAVDCPDGSDETFPLCRNTGCLGFQCVYGGCVEEAATCNGVQDCADNSDELLMKCRNELTFLECARRMPDEREHLCRLQWRTCKNGQVLHDYQKCDGKVDCDDGSDETLETCATDQRFCQSLTILPTFRCRYGACVEQSKVCDGINDCMDGSDELYDLCNTQTEGEWECDDGTNINATLKCNGVVDCPDGSDETFVTCGRNECPLGFRCAYGGCVKNNVTCDGVKDCLDNSDELLTKCKNKQSSQECHYKVRWQYNTDEDSGKKLKECSDIDTYCKNGEQLEYSRFKCDGRVHCADGSDETLETCATDRQNCLITNSRPHDYFKCKYGGCVGLSKVCNKVNDCADGSDELDEICNVRKCVLPAHPKNGHYTVPKKPKAQPGQSLRTADLVYSCNPGYKLNAPSPHVSCTNGSWADEQRICLAQCHLKKDPSIIYWCSKGLVARAIEECGELVAEGTTVQPQCRGPNYHHEGALTSMHCFKGTWDRQVATCSPHCGLVSSEGVPLIINGTSAKKGELPWHAAIYRKSNNKLHPYALICGGSLISNSIVISAAHCFWSNRLLPASRFVVALGKIYRRWNSTRDADAQIVNVEDIKIPPYYHGSETNFQDDIALVILATPVEYRSYVRPVCLDFDPGFESKQLATGKKGKITGWGLVAEDGNWAAPVLKVTELGYVDIDRCYQESPPSFHMFLSRDKFCASNQNVSAVCYGDSGGGLVFPSREGTIDRYYLRGVASTQPRNNHSCNIAAHTTFTQISKHQAFIQEHWN